MSSAVTRRSVKKKPQRSKKPTAQKTQAVAEQAPLQIASPQPADKDSKRCVGDRTRSHDVSAEQQQPIVPCGAASSTKRSLKRKRPAEEAAETVCENKVSADAPSVNWPKRRKVFFGAGLGGRTARVGQQSRQTKPKLSAKSQQKSAESVKNDCGAKRTTRQARKRKDPPVEAATPTTTTTTTQSTTLAPALDDKVYTPDKDILAALLADDETDNDNCVDEDDLPAEREPSLARPRIDYMVAANPVGKPRVVGAPKRNRKEQMAINDQIRAGKDLAKSFGVVQLGNESAAESDAMLSDSACERGNDQLPPLPADICVDGNTSSSAAEGERRGATRRRGPQQRPKFMRSLRSEEKERVERNNALKKFGPLRVMRQIAEDDNDGDDKDKDEDEDGQDQEDVELPDAESAIIKRTSSDMLKPYDFSSWDSTQQYDDEQFSEYASDAQTLSDNAIRDYAARIVDSGAEFTDEQKLDMARAFFANCGYGVSAITMEDFDVTRVRSDDHAATKHMHEASGDATKNCRYPTRSNLCCRYDHQRFDGVPILMPLCYHADKNILEVLPNMVFCSFACLMAYVNREMPRMHSNVRADRVSLVRFMARKWFGITEKIRMAPFLEQHRNYGGRLSTRQFRALSQTHYSFVQYPLAVAVPARYVTEIFVSRKIDRAKRQGLNLRVSEQHGNQLPEMPLALDIDPSAPAAPRGAEARARATKAKAARQKKLGTAAGAAGSSGGGGGGSSKKRVAVAPDGTRKTIDRAYVENVIRKTAEQQKQKPRKKHALEAMLGIKSVTCGDFLSSTHEDDA